MLCFYLLLLYLFPHKHFFFRQKEKTLKDLKDQISMFQQTLTVKDQLIMDLTNKIHELSNNSFDIFDQDKTTGYCKPFPNCPKYLTVERKELQRLCVSISFFCVCQIQLWLTFFGFQCTTSILLHIVISSFWLFF